MLAFQELDISYVTAESLCVLRGMHTHPHPHTHPPTQTHTYTHTYTHTHTHTHTHLDTLGHRGSVVVVVVGRAVVHRDTDGGTRLGHGAIRARLAG